MADQPKPHETPPVDPMLLTQLDRLSDDLQSIANQLKLQGFPASVVARFLDADAAIPETMNHVYRKLS